jgi:hypothetical protein
MFRPEAGSSVGIVTRIGVGRSKNGGSIPDRRRLFFSIKFRPAFEPTQPPIQLLQMAVSPGLKLKGREDCYPSSCSAEVMNGGAIPPLLIRLYGAVLLKKPQWHL